MVYSVELSDLKAVVQQTAKVVRVLERANDTKWTAAPGDGVAFLTTAVLWMCFAPLVARLAHLHTATASSSDPAVVASIAGRIAKALATMDCSAFPASCPSDLSVHSVVQSLVIWLSTVVSEQDKECVVELIATTHLSLDDFATTIERELRRSKAVPPVVLVCAHWMKKQPSADALRALAHALETSRNEPLYGAVYLCYAEAVPRVSLLLLERVLALLRSRSPTLQRKKFVLESVGIAIRALDAIPDPLVDVVVSLATRESDANLRAAAMKSLRLNMSKLREIKMRDVLAVTASVVVQDRAKSVGLAALRLLTEASRLSKSNDNGVSSEIAAFVSEQLWQRCVSRACLCCGWMTG